MVVVDVDHPDIEDFVNWKVKEEQKVASLVVGSKICEKHLKEIMDACWNNELDNEKKFDPKSNSILKSKIIDAKKPAIVAAQKYTGNIVLNHLGCSVMIQSMMA